MADIYAFVKIRLGEFFALRLGYHPKDLGLSFPILTSLVAVVTVYLLVVSPRCPIQSDCDVEEVKHP